MTPRWIAVVVLATALSGCRSARESDRGSQAAELNARVARLDAARAQPDAGQNRGAPLARWLLPASLREISGLALTDDGRLFTHGDERGDVWEIDYRRGVLLKQFTLGTNGVEADFEGIAVVHDAIFMIASDGMLYVFKEGANRAHVAYEVHDSRLAKTCEFEGIAFDAPANALLLACKNVRAKGLKGSLVIYRWMLANGGGLDTDPLTIPIAEAVGGNGWKDLHPSDITVDPTTGHYVIIASQEKALIEITPTGEVVRSGPLPGTNAQPEGVAISRDGLLIVSDEATAGAATIRLYRWPL